MCEACAERAVALETLLERFNDMVASETDPFAARRLRRARDELADLGGKLDCTHECDVVWSDEPDPAHAVTSPDQ